MKIFETHHSYSLTKSPNKTDMHRNNMIHTSFAARKHWDCLWVDVESHWSVFFHIRRELVVSGIAVSRAGKI